MRFAIVMAVVLLIVPASIGSDSAPVNNGIWWNSLDGNAKGYFVAGYVEGLSRADKILEQALRDKSLTLTDTSTKKPILSYFLFYNVAFGQFTEGLDTFYSDYRNKHINFNIAILYIRDQIQGVAQKELDGRLDRMRQATADADYDKQ